MDKQQTKAKVDEDLYSRQIAVYGTEMMGKLVQLKVFIHGLQGIGIEVAKNLILAGPNTVTVHDDESCQIQDLSTNFYITQEAINKKLSRSAACHPKLRELNSYVNVEIHTGNITTDYLSKFSVVVFTDFYDKTKLIEFNEFCRKKNIGFIVAGNLGLYGYTFVDFGDKFTVFDKNGEANRSTIVTSITQEEKALISVHDEKRHGFEDGDYITFREVSGMTEINGQVYKITVKSPYTFLIDGDTRKFSPYVRDGIAEQVKVAQEIASKSFAQSLQCPFAPGRNELDICDYSKIGRAELEHLVYNAILEFYASKKQLPRLNNEEDANELVAIAKKIDSNNKSGIQIEGILKVDNFDEQVVKNIARFAHAQICPMTSFWGGIIAQEVVKFTGKYMPIRQWLHYDVFEALPEGQVQRKLDNNRYDYITAIFGNEIQQKLANSKIFMVGAGALGCELLKLYALTGVGTGKTGKVFVTDDDMIENSNLNRQFLFRKENIKQSKSLCASNAVKQMNKDLSIQAFQSRVDPENEKIFNDDFWNSLDFAVNAVDNVKARLFIDGKCVWFGKALFESGTLGTKCNSQIIIPNVSQPYGETNDPAEEQIPLCTLKNFPHQIEHTIQWGRDYFESSLVEIPNETIKFLENPKLYVEKTKIQLSNNLPSLKFRFDEIKMMLTAYQKGTYEPFVEIARNQFEDIFHNQIASLLYSFPLDQKTESGQPFWSGPKRPPKIINFDLSDPIHIEFIQSCANILCKAFGLPQEKDPEKVKQIVAKVKVLEFTPQKVAIPDDKKKSQEQDSEEQSNLLNTTEQNINILAVELLKLNIKPKTQMKQNEFEKDDPTNWHIEFVSAVANLRARNYQIKEVSKFQVKLIAGKIIPALATTTAMVVGAVGIEIIKYIEKKPLGAMRNLFSNLALPLWLFSEPNQPNHVVDKDYDPISLGPVKAIPPNHTSWDVLNVNGPMTVEQFIAHFKQQYQISINMITVDKYIIYSMFQKEQAEKNLKQDIAHVIEQLGQSKIPEYKKYIPMIISGDFNGVDCTTPVIKYKLK